MTENNQTKETKGKDVNSSNKKKSKWTWLVNFFKFFGIEISRGTKHPVHITKRFFMWVLVFFVAFIILNIGMYSYSTNPKFCNSCHIMAPYFKAWDTSKHKGIASCVDCHYPPSTSFAEHMWHKIQASTQVVKYITRTYSSKPFAVIHDESCLRSGCHSKRLLEGKTKTPKGVKFDHGPHINEKRKDRQLTCTSCHSQIVVGTHIEVTYETCFLCHFKNQGEGRSFNPLGGCMGCHETPTSDFKIGNVTYNHKDYVVGRQVPCQNCHIDVVEGDGHAPKERCTDCHNDPGRLKFYEDLKFLHEKHVTQNHAACNQCHLAIKHKVTKTDHPRDESVQSNCILCHTDKHTGQKMLYMGVGGRGVEDKPSAMYTAQVDCVGCHYEPKSKDFDGKTYEPSKHACVVCHGEDYSGIFDMWQDDIKARVAKTKAKLDTAQNFIKNNPDKVTLERTEALKDAKYNYDFVIMGHGIHNPDYAGALLDYADKQLDAVVAP